ncbi:MAG: hypothetical protein WC565_08435 [Parcubacteria group bacterium]
MSKMSHDPLDYIVPATMVAPVIGGTLLIYFIGGPWLLGLAIMYPLTGLILTCPLLPDVTWKTPLFLMFFWLPALLFDCVGIKVP